MKRLADGLYLLGGLPPYAINVYLMGDVLVDAGTRHAARRILRQVRGHQVSALALTPAHPDHQGSCHAVCEALGIPLWCGSADAAAVEDPVLMLRRLPQNWLTRTIGPLWAGPAQPVARRLREGDEVGGFTVLETPGH
jgi:hydroxyacylglutathione hydrolase